MIDSGLQVASGVAGSGICGFQILSVFLDITGNKTSLRSSHC